MHRIVLFVVLALLVLSIFVSVVSFLPFYASGKQTVCLINNTFRLSSQETYRQGLGSFHGDEIITIHVDLIDFSGNRSYNFSLLRYGGPQYSISSTLNVSHSLPATPDYYEAVFVGNSGTDVTLNFQVTIEKPSIIYQYAWIGIPAKTLFLLSWSILMIMNLKLIPKNNVVSTKVFNDSKFVPKGRKLRYLQIAVLFSLIFWLGLLVLNSYPLATFEDWYTDSARHPYTSILFTKVGFSVFDTPLGALSTSDGSLYKFVSWAEMPHLYPLGSIMLFLPFGAMLQSGMAQALVFKMELAFLLSVSHLGLYYFLKHFWREELYLAPKPIWKQELSFFLKILGTYLVYVILVVYAANGQFDTVAFLFALPAFFMFMRERFDWFLFLSAVALTLKYQAGIFLTPLVLVSLIRIAQQPKPLTILKNKAVLVAIALVAVNLFTAYLSAPFLMAARPEFIMNAANAFSPHAQISWSLQAFTVMLTLAVTLISALYLFNRSPLFSLFAVFTLLPVFTMPYFQAWYLIFFFVYPLIYQSKRSLAITLIWIIFIVMVLSYGGLSYNPLTILDNIRRVLHF